MGAPAVEELRRENHPVPVIVLEVLPGHGRAVHDGLPEPLLRRPVGPAAQDVGLRFHVEELLVEVVEIVREVVEEDTARRRAERSAVRADEAVGVRGPRVRAEPDPALSRHVAVVARDGHGCPGDGVRDGPGHRADRALEQHRLGEHVVVGLTRLDDLERLEPDHLDVRVESGQPCSEIARPHLLDVGAQELVRIEVKEPIEPGGARLPDRVEHVQHLAARHILVVLRLAGERGMFAVLVGGHGKPGADEGQIGDGLEGRVRGVVGVHVGRVDAQVVVVEQVRPEQRVLVPDRGDEADLDRPAHPCDTASDSARTPPRWKLYPHGRMRCSNARSVSPMVIRARGRRFSWRHVAM